MRKALAAHTLLETESAHLKIVCTNAHSQSSKSEYTRDSPFSTGVQILTPDHRPRQSKNNNVKHKLGVCQGSVQ